MATLRVRNVLTLGWGREPSRAEDSPRLRRFVRQAYKKTGGPTKELERVYGSFVDNERRRESSRK